MRPDGTSESRTVAAGASAPGLGTSGLGAAIERLAGRPERLLVLLSLLFGTLAVLVTPPLRGPDEPAHFLRIYGYVHGELIPSEEIDGRKGIRIPKPLHRDYTTFEDARHRFWDTPGFSYREAFADFLRAPPADDTDVRAPPVFVPYQGSEGYSPVAYLPQIGALALAELFGLGLVPMLALMRLANLLAATAVMAWAVAAAPRLKWLIVSVAMLPSALAGRTVVSADGMALATAMMVSALGLRASLRAGAGGILARALWTTACALTKPPQLAFVLIEAMIRHAPDAPRRWRTLATVTAPALVLGPAWVLAVGAEVAAWRVYLDDDLPREQFDPVWKLGFMVDHPLHFPTVVLGTFAQEGVSLWRQMIGVLGWLDIPLADGLYGAATAVLLLLTLDRLDIERRRRIRVAAAALATAAGYLVAVFLILFLTWTPTSETLVWGVQGRYFVVALPAVAIAVAALVDVALPRGLAAATAIAGALLCGGATVTALWSAHW